MWLRWNIIIKQCSLMYVFVEVLLAYYKLKNYFCIWKLYHDLLLLVLLNSIWWGGRRAWVVGRLVLPLGASAVGGGWGHHGPNTTVGKMSWKTNQSTWSSSETTSWQPIMTTTQICPKYTKNMPKIIPDICHKRHEYIRVNFFGRWYAQNMPKIYPRYLRYA